MQRWNGAAHASERALLPGKEADFLQHVSVVIAVCPQLEHDSQDGFKNNIAVQSRFQVNRGTFFLSKPAFRRNWSNPEQKYALISIGASAFIWKGRRKQREVL